MKRLLLFFAVISPLCLWAQNSPYVNKVYEFRPAPGQFVNVLPTVEAGDTQEDVLHKVEEAIVGKANGSLVSLGAWGGYIVVGFDHAVQNIEGEYDLKIYGNAMSNASEPGIVMVAQDLNANGIPDDTWYELKGSEHENTLTKSHYKVTYYRPQEGHIPQPHPTQTQLTDIHYIQWKDSEGAHGYVEKNVTHTQEYYPLWQEEDSLVFQGTRLPDNATDQNGDGTLFVVQPYEWGYADNQPNGKETSCVKIEWAVDEQGNVVDLNYIHFVKIYTGVLQASGWTGECSTEISGVVDLHALASSVNKISQDIYIIYNKGILTTTTPAIAVLEIYDLLGNRVWKESLPMGTTQSTLPINLNGIYIVRLQVQGAAPIQQKLWFY